MAAAPTTYGFPYAAIDAAALPEWVKTARARFSVSGIDDWKVSPLGSLDRGIRVEVGTGHGDGVTVQTHEYETMSLPLPDVASGWFMIARRRNWSGNGTATLVALPVGATPELPTVGNAATQMSNTPGVESDQPIALVPVTRKDRTVGQGIIDLRVWAGPGGIEAAHELALTYLGEPGASVKIGGTEHRYELQANNVWDWRGYPLGVDDTGDVNIGAGGTAFGNGWEAFSGGGYSRLAYRKVGKQVQIFGSARVRVGVGAASVVAVMPAGLRPSGKVPGVRCEMNPDGALRAEGPWAAGGTPSFFVSYFVP